MTAWNNEAFSPEALAALFGGLQGTDTVSVDADGGTPGSYTHTFTVTWDGNPIGDASLTDEGRATFREIAAQLALYGEPVDAEYERRWRSGAMIRWSDAVERRIDVLVMRAKRRSAHQRARLSTQTRRRGR